MAPPINILLLIELVAVVIASSAFLFYLNRLGGSVVAFIVRLLLWRKHHVWVTIGSLQISLLAGRITFRDIEYHSSNISARALHGHITWRYWKFRIRQSEDVDSNNSNRNSLPCRIRIHAEGFEAFLYNRTPAYDEIVKRMQKHEAEAKAGKEGSKTSEASSASHHDGLRSRTSIRRDQTKGSSGESSNVYFKSQKTGDPRDEKDEPMKDFGVDYFRELCPVEVTIKQGSVILGNDATPSVLIAHFTSAKGTLNSVDSRSPCDLRKDVYDLRFEKVNILTRTNVDYSGPLLAHGKKAYDQLLKERPETANEPPSSLSARLGFHHIARTYAFLKDPKFSTPPVAGLPRDRIWRGLARYRNLDDQAPKRQPRREEREYAKVTTLVETPVLELTYYSDVPGPVPSLDDPVIVDPTDEIGNVEAPPEYGIDITVHGGIIKYGPWADRQRDALQTAFAPSIFFDSDPRSRLRTGDTRVHTHMLLNVSLSEETTLRMPTREPSKDWMYDGHPASEEERRYGWLDITVGANSSVVYTQSQIATSHGYDTMLALHLDSLSIASSINLHTFVRSKSCKLAITMPTPLRWDAQRDWGFDVTLEEPDITLMRDHTTLISDLARDWSSGLQGDFHHFVPNHYNFRVTILNYGIHLFLNDYNIIDDPRTRADNAMADFYGPRLDAYVAVATTQYRPEFSVVPFSVEARDIKVELGLPRWDTHRGTDGSEVVEIGKIGEIIVTGSYRYYSEPKPDHQETLTLHLEGRRVAFKAYGWALRRLFCVKDNYFGGFTSFRTMDEFFERFDHDPRTVGDPVEEKYRSGRSDPYAVQVTMNVEDSLVVMPDQIYGCEKGVVIPVSKLQMSLRSQEQFMDLSLDSPPTSVIPVDDLIGVYNTCTVPPIEDDAIFLEGIELKANRLFGPQPRAETYLCLWEAVVPQITCCLSVPFVSTLQSVLAAVAYNFTDPDNAPAAIYQPAALPDVTFFKLSLGELSVLLTHLDSAISVELPQGVNLDLNTCASRSSGTSTSLLVPSVAVHTLSRRDTSNWETVGQVTSGASIDIYSASQGWRDAAAKQQAFIRKEDANTRRITYLYADGKDVSSGQFNHQVFVPTPRPSDDSSSEEDSSDDEDDQFRSEEAVSSPGSSGSEEHIRTRPRPSRKRSSRRTQTHSTAESEDTDSDSATGCSWTSSDHTSRPPASTMPSVLAERLRQFNSMRRHVIDFKDDLESATSERDTLPATSSLRCGSIIKIVARPVHLVLQPESFRAVSSIAISMKETPRRPELLLDGLLIAHTDDLAANPDVENPTVLDFRLPLIRARVHHGIFEEPSPVIDVLVKDLGTRLSKSTNGGHPAVDVAILVKKADINLCVPNPTMRLSYPSGAGLSSTSVTRLLFEGLEFSLEKSHRHIRLVSRLSLFNTSVVTPAFQHIHDVARIWQHAVEQIPKATDGPDPVAIILYQAVRAAVENRQTLSQPAFAYESSYGLHVDDQRNIRRDLGWSMLSRIRHWLRTLHMPSGEPVDDIEGYTISELALVEDWAGDSEEFIRQQMCMRLAFGREIRRPTMNQPTSLDHTVHLFANIDVFHLEHCGRLLESDQVAASSIRVVSASTGVQYLVALKGSRKVKRVRAINTIKAIELELQNSLISAIEPLICLAPSTAESSTEVDSSTRGPADDDEEQIILMDNHVERAEVVTIAAGLQLRGVLDKASVNVFAKKASSPIPEGPTGSAYTSATTMIHSIETTLSARPRPLALSVLPPGEVVAICRLKEMGGMVTHQTPEDGQLPDQLRVLMSLRQFGLDIRPQMKVLRGLIENLRDQEYPHYKSIIQDYHATVAPASRPRAPETSSPSRPVNATVDLSLKSVDLTARAAPSLWLRWELGNTYLTASGLKENVQFGLRMDSQLVGAYSTLQKSRSRDSSTLRLPTIKARGTYQEQTGQGSLSGTLDLGVFTGVMQPATLNRLLDLHRDLGEDVVNLSRQYSHQTADANAAAEATEGASSEPVAKPLILDVAVSMDGLQIGLRADKVSTAVVLEASALNGYISHSGHAQSSLMWQVKAQQLGISLGHLDSKLVSQGIASSRRYRSASMVLDVDVQDIPARTDYPRQLSIRLSRVHTIMHVAALKELVDLSRSWSHDIQMMREARATEIAEVKAQSSKFKQKMQAKSAGTEKPLSSAWLAERLVTINMTGIGIAIPLDASTTIDMLTLDQNSGPAMLFSIRTMGFQNKRNQTARFRMQQMELQFVDSFDQGKVEHFVGDYHPSPNRMTVPLIDSEAEISSEPGTWKTASHCSATDFQLSLAPSIADNIFRLIVMYKRGKKHIAQLEEEYRNGLAQFGQVDSTVAKYVEQSSIPSKLAAQQILVKMSFTFNSGIVLLSHKPLDKSRKPDRLVLPSISLWVDYTGAAVGVDDSDEGGILLINSAIHESRNEVKPSLIPFIVDLVRRIRHHPDDLEDTTQPLIQTADPTPVTEADTTANAGETALQAIAHAPTGRLKVRSTLRIDQSELKFSCGSSLDNLSDAMLNLTWESGGFVASTTLGGDEVTSVAGTITGVTIQLRHEHAGPEKNCIQAGAKDMAFTLAYCPSARYNGQRGLSFVFDSSVSAQFRLDAYSAWLCFMAVWVDDVWKFGTPAKPIAEDTVDTSPATSAHPLRLGIVVLARFRSIDFDVSLPVTRAQLQIAPLVLRTMADGQKTDLGVQIGEMSLHAKGDISGDITSKRFVMHSIRQSSRTNDMDGPSVLAISIDGGELSGSAYLGHTRIILFHLAPTKVFLSDDWSSRSADSDHDVVLLFNVDAGKFMGIVRAQDLPRLLGVFYDIVREAENQEKRAKSFSAPFRQTKERKADQPSAITAALLQTARKASLTGNSTRQMRIKETMVFKLEALDLGAFILDNEGEGQHEEFYRFEIGATQVDLSRIRNDLNHRLRDIKITVDFARWTNHEGRRAAIAEKQGGAIVEMMAEIAKNKDQKAFFPHAVITMSSEQIPSEPVDVLEHDCSLEFDEKNASQISFTPAFYSYAWRVGNQLKEGIDEQKRSRARDRDSFLARTKRVKSDGGDAHDDNADSGSVEFSRKKGAIKIPGLNMLKDSTKEILRWYPKWQTTIDIKTPVYVHRFVTVPLEDLMDQLLKLYEKQLPANSEPESDHDIASSAPASPENARPTTDESH